MFYRVVAFALLCFAPSAVCHAGIRLPCVFQDHMVLQRGTKIPVWGWASPGEKVTVSFDSASAAATADAGGTWKALLPPMTPGGPHTFTVRGSSIVTVRDVLVGDVWLCSGQANMEMGVKAAQNGVDEVAAAKYPKIRLFFGGGDMAETPQVDEKNGSWWVCGPETVGYFSAVGYFFARAIHQAEQVPVGILNVSWSGTQIEGWIPRTAYLADLALAPMLATVKTPLASTMPAVIYNSRIHPLAPFALRGVLWYQGESNVSHPALYRSELPALIRGWRQAWGQGDFPLLIVQLPNFLATREQPGESQWAELREAQAMAYRLPNAEYAVTIDIGDAQDIHPKNKQEVARRLALIALDPVLEERRDAGQAAVEPMAERIGLGRHSR
ncbi:MAG: sialate O-acetylesterase, partial [Bryobacteraceae bacterium]